MNSDSTKKPANAVRPYEVGYGKPPAHTRFQKGVSGNPRGGSRKAKLRRARALAMKEAYRLITVREGDKTMRLPAIQAVMRSQVALAAKGNGPAQRPDRRRPSAGAGDVGRIRRGGKSHGGEAPIHHSRSSAAGCVPAEPGEKHARGAAAGGSEGPERVLD
jgi:hypothetical protein